MDSFSIETNGGEGLVAVQDVMVGQGVEVLSAPEGPRQSTEFAGTFDDGDVVRLAGKHLGDGRANLAST